MITEQLEASLAFVVFRLVCLWFSYILCARTSPPPFFYVCASVRPLSVSVSSSLLSSAEGKMAGPRGGAVGRQFKSGSIHPACVATHAPPAQSQRERTTVPQTHQKQNWAGLQSPHQRARCFSACPISSTHILSFAPLPSKSHQHAPSLSVMPTPFPHHLTSIKYDPEERAAPECCSSPVSTTTRSPDCTKPSARACSRTGPCVDWCVWLVCLIRTCVVCVSGRRVRGTDLVAGPEVAVGNDDGV